MSTSAIRRERVAVGNLILLTALAMLIVVLWIWHARELIWTWPGERRVFAASLCAAAWCGFVALVAWRRRAISTESHADVSGPAGAVTLLAYASQTGFAAELARQTAQSLQSASTRVRLCELGQLDASMLATAERVLFIVSTTGEGDAPDAAAGFVRQTMARSVDLSRLRFGLLALGDSDYADFCGFGRRLEHWLRACGAQAWFDPVQVDNGDPSALRHWQHHLSLLTGTLDMPDWQRPHYRRWQLVERRHLNPGSLGEACFHLALHSLEGEVSWQAGDLVEIGPQHGANDVTRWLEQAGLDGQALVASDDGEVRFADLLARSRLPDMAEVVGVPMQRVADDLQLLPHREYSIASVPEDGAIHLLVRQMRREDGQLGLGSAWLTVHAALGADMAVRIRSNPPFHAPDDARPMILIGNGTGIAGLRALLKARVAAGHRRNWLLFGERRPEHDNYYRDEIERWQAAGMIEQLDLVWSRAGPERVYVQDRLRERAVSLHGWVDAGAAIYVCGSLAGMAPGVEASLVDVLGTETVEQLRMEGRYRRDVY
ncbi:sulfite reductase flavoprotein subunit alpha [Dyella sp. GSA-30]|uniref:sulfite reductase subunit alpha n=1 Tax=Dyella sp. GSA-30 TaxID=2994496 RepID=UPI0024922865|nr:sulfite reductase flavoprotein subunit alpha [Dyella sp. GSA-30]BDU20557.1 sulfite reductase subunit alpha [Dyella sp. GSA-30]